MCCDNISERDLHSHIWMRSFEANVSHVPCVFPLLFIPSHPHHMNPIVAYQMIYAINVDILDWFGDWWPLSCFLPMHKYKVFKTVCHRGSVSYCIPPPAVCMYNGTICWLLLFSFLFITGWPGRYWAKGKSCFLSLTGELRGCYEL